jgi:hypothetical protein
METNIMYEGLEFTIQYDLIPAENGSYDTEPFEKGVDINGISLGGNCVDFMLNERTTRILKRLILELC